MRGQGAERIAGGCACLSGWCSRVLTRLKKGDNNG